MIPYFNDCDLVVVPIFEGGGMKVKVAEAMSYDKPVVTTSHGAIDYKIVNGENVYIASTPEGSSDQFRIIIH